MTKMKTVIMLLTMLSVAAQADTISLGSPVYGGTGCPQGSATTFLTDDSSAIGVAFDSYNVEAGRRRSLARKSCSLAIPVHVPQGLSIALIHSEYLLYNSLPLGATSVFDTEFFFAGATGVKTSSPFEGALDDYTLDTSDVLLSSAVWSECGKDTILRLNTSMKVKTNASGDYALASVDTLYSDASLLYSIRTRACE